MGSNKNPEFKGRDPVLNKIMKVVSAAYPDGLVSLYWNNAKVVFANPTADRRATEKEKAHE